MITREIQPLLLELAGSYPVVTITGPRQAGKTTLAKMAFPGYHYCNLEHPETRRLAMNDPVSFFSQHPAPLIVDEIQRVPGLLSYIQVMVDELGLNGQFILTGSQQLNLNAAISQSLAGRTALLTLLPFSLKEIAAATLHAIPLTRDGLLYSGGLPRIYDQQQNPLMAYRNYLQTYVERDVRQLLNVKDMVVFDKFLRLLAGRVGQLLNMSSLAGDVGVSVATINNWLSVLEASFILFRLNPYYENFGKRITKAPKIYFVETGLACYLLGIEKELQLARDPLLGGLFENLMVSEALKFRLNKGLDPNLFYFRDSNNNEVDLLLKWGKDLIPVEIKSSQTWHDNFAKGIVKFLDISNTGTRGLVVYGGDHSFSVSDKVEVTGFRNMVQGMESLLI